METALTKNILPSQPKLTLIKAKGAILWDSDGKDYIDFSSQTLNLSLGQCHPSITKAAIRQLKRYTFISSRFIDDSMQQIASTLVKIAPYGLTKVNVKLTNGSDANESAFKRVRKFHMRQTIVAFNWSHHGETGETINACGKHFENRSYIGGSGKFLFFDPPHPNFFPNCKTIPESESASITQLKQLLKTEPDICAVIVEPILVNAGVYILSSQYLKKLQKICNEYNISLIFDEIQTAFGWLGTIFAASKYGVTPDLLTLGKALAPGFPLAAILMKEKYDVLEYGEDEFTYGGHPMSCAVALENIRLLQSMPLSQIITEKETILQKRLMQIQKKFSFIREIRGEGVIWALDLDISRSPCSADALYQEALKNGVILRKSRDGQGTSLVLKPSIIIPKKHLHMGLDRLLQSIQNLS